MKFEDQHRLTATGVSPFPSGAAAPAGAQALATTCSLQAQLPPVSRFTTNTVMAPWRPDQLLIPTGEVRANVVAIGGFRECGPYHFQAIGEDLKRQGCLVRLTSLFDHQEGQAISRTFTPRNIMSKAVHDVQETLKLAPHAPLVLIGFSAGGLAALQLAQRFAFHPIAAVVVEGFFASSDSVLRRAYPLLLRLKQKHFSAERWDKEASRVLSYGPSPVPAPFRTTLWDARPRVPGVTVSSILALDDFRRETLSCIQESTLSCPVYFAHGMHDRSSSFLDAQRMFRHLAERGGCGEMLQLSHSAHSIALGKEADAYREWLSYLIERALNQSFRSSASR